MEPAVHRADRRATGALRPIGEEGGGREQQADQSGVSVVYSVNPPTDLS